MGNKSKKQNISYDCYRVKPGSKIALKDWDAGHTDLFNGGKEEAREELQSLCVQMEALQEVLYAENKHRILIVLQGMDTAGKDGLIRHVFGPLNPQGVRVVSFKTPSEEERSHDYLWRVHRATPSTGQIVVFNRSHYEDVLIVAVRNLIPPNVWGKRYAHINDFERMLADEGTTILKFFLLIDKDEQKDRLQARLDNPNKRWKFRKEDLAERKLWPKYLKAYESAIGKTSSVCAPWYIVPANKKWYRNLVVANVVLKQLQSLKMKYPKA